VIHLVTSVIQNNIGHSKFVNDALQELFVALVANANKNARLLVVFALFVNIDANNFGERTKISLPLCKDPPLNTPISRKVKDLFLYHSKGFS
jgi:hypothetical protein